MKIIVLGILVVITALIATTNGKKNVVCYVGTWATYRWGNGKFDVNNIDPHLCTHLIYTFFGIEENGELKVLDPYLDLEDNWGRGNIKQFNALKQLNPKLKTLAAVGGWNEGSIKYSNVAKDPVKRLRFINGAISFALKHNFDGIDFDWEYPAQRGGDVAVDKANFVTWLKEFRAEVDKHNLLLSAAVGSAEFSASQSYDIPNVAKYLDLINVMAYDLHGQWDSTIGINAPLYAGPADVTEKQKQLNVDSCIQYWLKQGAPAHKINLGIPLYGHTFTLADPKQTKPGSPFNGPGQAGPYTQQPGSLGYNEFCEKNKVEQWTKVWEETQQVPYAFRGNQWYGYDDERSVKLKVEYANKYNLGGVMVWSLETDDFNGVCGIKYPLMKAINKALGGNIPPDPSSTTDISSTHQTTNSTTSMTTSKPTSSPDPEFKCTKDGTFRDPYDCSVFYVCSTGAKYTFKCPSDLWFDTNSQVCNYKHLVDCTPLPLSNSL